MPRVASDDVKKADGSYNVSACMRAVLMELGLDALPSDVAAKLKADYGIKELPPNLYVIRKSLKDKGGKPGKSAKAVKAVTSSNGKHVPTSPPMEATSGPVETLRLGMRFKEAAGGKANAIAMLEMML